MADDFDDMNDANFETFGTPAKYRAGGLGGGVDVTVIRTQPDASLQGFGAQLTTPTTMFDLRASEAASKLGAVPKEGDTVTLLDRVTLAETAERFKVQGKPKRNDRLARVWTLDTVPA